MCSIYVHGRRTQYENFKIHDCNLIDLKNNVSKIKFKFKQLHRCNEFCVSCEDAYKKLGKGHMQNWFPFSMQSKFLQYLISHLKQTKFNSLIEYHAGGWKEITV